MRQVVTVVGGLVDEAWSVIEPNLHGLTDQEYFWEPAPNCWSVRRREHLTTADSWGRGDYAVETSFDGSEQPTTTTIAWRLLHAYDCFRDYASRAFGHGPLDWNDIEIPGSAAVATAMMAEAVADVRRYLEGTDAVLFEHEGDRPHWRLLDIALLEWIHHCAEIGVLRSMYALTHSNESRFAAALAAIDAANAADPSHVHGEPLALYEGRTAHQWTLQLDPAAPEPVQLAARAHHLRRWELPRADYPEGRDGYLRWRRDQQRRHADDLANLLRPLGYDAATIERTATIIRKRGLGTDPDVQLFEDAVALTFLQSQLSQTRSKLADDDKLVDVLRRTLAKMSERGRAAALTIDVDDAMAPLVASALVEGGW